MFVATRVWRQVSIELGYTHKRSSSKSSVLWSMGCQAMIRAVQPGLNVGPGRMGPRPSSTLWFVWSTPGLLLTASTRVNHIKYHPDSQSAPKLSIFRSKIKNTSVRGTGQWGSAAPLPSPSAFDPTDYWRDLTSFLDQFKHYIYCYWLRSLTKPFWQMSSSGTVGICTISTLVW